MEMKRRLKVYSDGASRGNPGPAAIAFKIITEDGEILREHSEYLGTKTNNQAEYAALISALDFASRLPSQEVVCHTDSELVVKHLSGEYQVRSPHLKTLWLKVQELKQRFQKISFHHVSRMDDYIQEVDCLANETLDRVLDRQDGCRD